MNTSELTQSIARSTGHAADGYVRVVAAAICDNENRVLIARRPDHAHQGGKWEFPGGKIEAGESTRDALCRELNEELAIEPTVFEPLIKIRHGYSDKRVRLDVWRVTRFQGAPYGREGQALAWVKLRDLDDYTFPEANHPIVCALRLPDTYLITPEPDSDWSTFLQGLENALKRGSSLVQFRAKTIDSQAYTALAKPIRSLCAKYHARWMINGEPEWTRDLGASGVHLTAGRLRSCKARPLPPRYLIGASCHVSSDILQANRIDADFAVISPVNTTLTHPGMPPLGWEQFRKLCERSTIPVYALGGMRLQDLPRAKRLGGQGIAAIRSLWPGEHQRAS